jgi:hypothetical protein
MTVETPGLDATWHDLPAVRSTISGFLQQEKSGSPGFFSLSGM